MGTSILPARAEGEVAAGRALYRQICINCHSATFINPAGATLDLAALARDDPARFVEAVKVGKNMMSPFASMLSDADIEAIRVYAAAAARP